MAVHLDQAERVAFDQAAEALRLPNAGERASEPVSGVRELSSGLRVPFEDRAAYGGSAAGRLDPPQAGRKPSRRDHSRRRRGLQATPDR